MGGRVRRPRPALVIVGLFSCHSASPVRAGTSPSADPGERSRPHRGRSGRARSRPHRGYRAQLHTESEERFDQPVLHSNAELLHGRSPCSRVTATQRGRRLRATDRPCHMANRAISRAHLRMVRRPHRRYIRKRASRQQRCCHWRCTRR